MLPLPSRLFFPSGASKFHSVTEFRSRHMPCISRDFSGHNQVSAFPLLPTSSPYTRSCADPTWLPWLLPRECSSLLLCPPHTHTPPLPPTHRPRQGSLDRTAFHKFSPVHAEGMSQTAQLTSQDEVMLIKMFSKKDCNHCTNCPLPKGQPATGVSTGSSAIASTV